MVEFILRQRQDFFVSTVSLCLMADEMEPTKEKRVYFATGTYVYLCWTKRYPIALARIPRVLSSGEDVLFSPRNRTGRFERLHAKSLFLLSPLPTPLFFFWNSSQASCEITLQRGQCNGTVTEISTDRNAGSRCTAPGPDAPCGLDVSNLPPGSTIGTSKRVTIRSRGAPRLIERARAQIPRLGFMCPRTSKAYRWEVECRTSSSKHTASRNVILDRNKMEVRVRIVAPV